MYEYIKGVVMEEAGDFVVVENNGFGYFIRISLNTMADLPKNKDHVFLFLHPVYKEDDISLYGFSTKEERQLFRTLIGISGIGPRVAMGVLSTFQEESLIHHILSGDAKAISKAPGIGKKTAERLVLELKDKYKDYEFSNDQTNENQGDAIIRLRQEDSVYNESVNGLLGLGFGYGEAKNLVDKVMAPEKSIENILQDALKEAAQGAR